MKVKSFAILATSSLLAAAFTYAVPALADDMAPSAQEMQQSLADNSSTTTQNANPTQNDLNSNTNSATSNSAANNQPTITDEAAPERDSATGDDDY
jgi:hypothetical protein